MVKNIIFDFDGVILESNDIKAYGFYELFKDFGKDNALRAVEHFKLNAGLSRYDIIKFFFTQVCVEKIDIDRLKLYANRYSSLVKDRVVESDFVDGFMDFVGNNEYNCFIASSTDENDLKYICNKIGISDYFKAILGSPAKKAKNIKKIISEFSLSREETIYVGDSRNDYEATIQAGLVFIGRNSGIYNFSKLGDVLVIDNLFNLNEKIQEIT